jgi:hypothetical protein
MVIDSGATVHVTPNKYLLLNPTSCYRKISVADGTWVTASIMGDVLIRSICGSLLYLKGILYSPSFTKNIISAPQLIKNQEYRIIMQQNTAEVQYRNIRLQMHHKKQANLYFLKGERLHGNTKEYLELKNKNKNSRVHVNLNSYSPYYSCCNDMRKPISFQSRVFGLNNAKNKLSTHHTPVQRHNNKSNATNINSMDMNDIIKPPKAKSMDINDAHYIMGHMGETALRNYLNHHNIKATGVFRNCVHCMKWKAHNKSVNKIAINKATYP